MKDIYYYFFCMLIFLTSQVGAKEFQYLEYKDSKIVSTHGIGFSLDIPPSFRKLEPINYTAVFNELPFNVTVAAIINEGKFIMLSAERLTDNSGVLDYSYYRSVELSGYPFFLRENCHQSLTLEDIASHKDVDHLQKNGFDLTKPTYISSFFMNSEDGNAEYIVHYGKNVSNCSEKTITEMFKKELSKEIEKHVDLRKL